MNRSGSTPAERLLHYLADEFDAAGASRTAPDNIQFYYKMPATFALAGRPDLAGATLDQFLARFFAEGTIDTRGDDMATGWIPYLAGWAAWGAAMLGRFDHGRALMGAAAHLQRDDGGFRVGSREDAPADVQRTGAALMGLAWNNEIPSARQAAQFLAGTIARQSEDDRFRALVDAEGQPLADAGDRNTYFDVGDEFARPAMFATPIAGLVWLHRLTGRPEHLAAARDYMALALRHPRAAALPLATKMGWAALMIHAHAPDEALARFAADTAGHQAGRQLADGSIGFRDMEGSPAAIDKVWLMGWGCDSLLTLISAPQTYAQTGGTG